MIIWISGAYGVGKSTLAEAMPGMHIQTDGRSVRELSCAVLEVLYK